MSQLIFYLGPVMRILSIKPGHDGSVAYLSDSDLIFCYESEKDSWPRYSAFTSEKLIEIFEILPAFPDVICMSGWSRDIIDDFENEHPIGAGYYGLNPSDIFTKKTKFMGQKFNYFTSSHERSHILCSYGMSTLEKGRPCYVLVWEGVIGSFYKIDEQFNINKIGSPLTKPGLRYAFLYALADKTFSHTSKYLGLEKAGKLMALTGYSTRNNPTVAEEVLINKLLSAEHITPELKEDLSDSVYHNVGLDNREFRNFAKIFSDLIFDKFYQYAKVNFTEKLPLLISGGCGLNCDWNSKWRDSGLASEVFVPPVTNDSGSAIGTAIDAQLYFTGDPKINWTVYSGMPFQMQLSDLEIKEFESTDFTYSLIANLLKENLVLAWVQGRYEIGPRALGNRSLLAAPFSQEIRDKLNMIKQREDFRPIAPLCLKEDAERLFDCKEDSPFMLYFYRVLDSNLGAITHVDKTARIQTVTKESNSEIFELLKAFKALTGYGVLCNTSLNFKGRGFINNLGDLKKYVIDRSIDGFICNDKLFIRKLSKGYEVFSSIVKEGEVISI